MSFFPLHGYKTFIVLLNEHALRHCFLQDVAAVPRLKQPGITASREHVTIYHAGRREYVRFHPFKHDSYTVLLTWPNQWRNTRK